MKLASFRRRILFRGVFLLLAIVTIAFAVLLLKEEKERSWRDYRDGFRKSVLSECGSSADPKAEPARRDLRRSRYSP